MSHHSTEHANLGGSMAAPSISLSPADQEKLEQEGAAAGLAGKTRAECPYDEGTFEFTFWLYGFGYASVEMMKLRDGHHFLSPDENPPSDFDLAPNSSIPVRRAIENGAWKPRYVTLAMLDEIEKGRAA